MGDLDEKDCIILNLLQEDCRMSYTEISKKVGLSVDSVKKRIDRMTTERIFNPKIQIRPRRLGFQEIVEVKIKVKEYDAEEIQKFVDYCTKHPRVAEIFSISGEWDFSIVLIAKNHADLGSLTTQIRNKFKSIIKDWNETLTKNVYKFEEYDMLKVMGFTKTAEKYNDIQGKKLERLFTTNSK